MRIHNNASLFDDTTISDLKKISSLIINTKIVCNMVNSNIIILLILLILYDFFNSLCLFKQNKNDLLNYK